MNLSIKLDIANETFFYDSLVDAGAVADMLRSIAVSLDNEGVYPGLELTLRDVNGNTVGVVKIS